MTQENLTSKEKLQLAAIWIALLSLAATWAYAFASEVRCDGYRKQYFKWGYFAALTKAPEAFEKLREYQAKAEACERD